MIYKKKVISISLTCLFYGSVHAMYPTSEENLIKWLLYTLIDKNYFTIIRVKNSNNFYQSILNANDSNWIQNYFRKRHFVTVSHRTMAVSTSLKITLLVYLMKYTTDKQRLTNKYFNYLYFVNDKHYLHFDFTNRKHAINCIGKFALNERGQKVD